MPQTTFEQVLVGVQSLPVQDQERLRALLNESSANEPTSQTPFELARAASSRDLSAERQWLKDHADEYAGQWVALKGSQLISHGTNARDVHAEAKAAGHPDALLEQVEATDAPSFIF